MQLVLRLGYLFIMFILFAFSCQQERKNTQNATNGYNENIPLMQNLVISAPEENKKFVIGELINCSYTFSDTSKRADSVLLRVNGQKAGISYSNSLPELAWNSKNELPGIKDFSFIAYYGNNTTETKHVRITLLSDIIPQQYTYEIENVYKHDVTAYTQGLVYNGGFIYESTGQEGLSSLRKMKYQTGEKMKILNLPPDIFGEGIALLNNKIYQLTYRTQIAYEYDLATFNLINKFSYPMREGWGLTTDGKSLIMSDGTSNLYNIDPEYFTETRRIEVLDNVSPIDSLNELEYIHNEIWANVYTTNIILRISPETGKVLGKIDMSNLLKPEDYHSSIDVLNGIAYDKENDRVFVTGKNWPKLFEVKIVKK